ncbi:MAG: hypothetical protein M1114_00305, partial [Candidatus Dependentiae bacterium]|nr:hypothetical protein [Candidatus Dependentiae bacterium]
MKPILKTILILFIFALFIPTNQNCLSIDEDVTWTATLVEQNNGSGSWGLDDNNTGSFSQGNDDYSYANDIATDTRKEMYLEKENERLQSQGQTHEIDANDLKQNQSVSIETFLIPEIENQPFIKDIIQQLEKLRAMPEERAKLEQERALLIQDINMWWYLGKDEARKKVTFIDEILDGTLIEELKSIENEKSLSGLINKHTILQQLWPWHHKRSFQVPPDKRSTEHAFNELLGINIMQYLELAVFCDPKILAKCLSEKEQLEIKEIIDEYRNYIAQGDRIKLGMAYNNLLWSINESHTIFKNVLSKIAVATAVSRYHTHDMQKNHERTTALKEQLILESESLAQVLTDYKALTPDNASILTTKQLARIRPLKNFLYNPTDWSSLAVRSYSLTDQSKDMLTLYGMDTETQKTLCISFGNDLQHAAYQECITAINDVALQHKESMPLSELETLIIDQALIGCEAAAAGHIKQAYSFADICWTALECIKGAGEGVMDAVENTAEMIIHPIDTVQNFASATYTLGYHLGKFLYDAGDIAITYMSDEDKAAEKYNAYYEKISLLCDAIQEQIKTKSARELVRAGVGFAVEAYLTGKALGSVNKFCKTAKVQALELAKKINTGEELVLSAENLSIKVASVASDTVKTESSLSKLQS